MAIFRRRQQEASEPQAQDVDPLETDDLGTDDLGTDDLGTDDLGTDDLEAHEQEALDDPAAEHDATADEPSFSRARGPYDVSEVERADEDADGPVDRLDLGALRFVPVDGMQLRLELDESQQTVLSVHCLLGDSSVQVQVFAAPRTLPVWPEIRAEIADNVISAGGTADVVAGELGRELVCRMPQRGADGRTVFAQVRFAGVDGPRWFLRAVFSGPAAVDERAAAPLVAVVRSCVVVRGDEAMPPREVLPLTLPQQATPEDEGAEELQDEVEPSTRRPDDLKPFERGPEITEVR
ncbi:DUF3710 domain-containing protein [Lapillicoccus jejuensis]|uniref:Uncharacterized protein DUF3710 n=1 Tax=Lapillicoccus jejuensis TaxID=402171 RepID=A0A542E5M3_9MICO|nr:DUF3710 domain-containing protein [Lapillicoccus jejuensis]TQJ10586.1 uncharacterized protein DUF3710 [Lapillicoccus jejuensis]